MKLLTKAIRKAAAKNAELPEKERVPVAKFFNPTGDATWLLSEIMPDDDDLCFGLCDLGMGFPELGYFRISELESVTVRFGLGIERDINWQADKTLAEYADEARIERRIVA